MKRCPECDFLYEDEQDHCDMDGTRLFFTTTLPPLPEGQIKPVWDKWTIALMAALVLGTVLVVLYRSTPRAASSSVPAATQASREMPVANQDAVLSESQSQLPKSNASQTEDASRDPFMAPSSVEEAKAEKSKRSVPPGALKEPTPVPVIHIQAATKPQIVNAPSTAANPATNQSPAKQTPATSQKPSAASNSTSIHPLPPETKTTAKPSPQSQVKDSKFKSFLKKLKRPFDN